MSPCKHSQFSTTMWTWKVAFLFGVVTSLVTSEELAVQTLSDLHRSFNDLVHYVLEVEKNRDDDLLRLTNRVEVLETLRDNNFRIFSKSIVEIEKLHELDQLTIRKLSEEVEIFVKENEHLESKVNNLNQTPVDIPRIHAKSISSELTRSGSSPGTIAFYAVLTQELTDPGVNQKIIFNKILTNINARISSYTGVFTCTHAGVHVFSWQTLLADTHYVIAELVRNGVSVGSEETGNTGTPISGASTAVIDLEALDEVWVRVAAHSVGSDIQPNLTTFSGFRLP